MDADDGVRTEHTNALPGTGSSLAAHGIRRDHRPWHCQPCLLGPPHVCPLLLDMAVPTPQDTCSSWPPCLCLHRPLSLECLSLLSLPTPFLSLRLDVAFSVESS